MSGPVAVCSLFNTLDYFMMADYNICITTLDTPAAE